MFARTAALAAAALVLAGCVQPDRPPPSSAQLLNAEAQKKEIAQMRDRGKITFEEAARRQFEIQRAYYALTEGEMSFWRASIEYAHQVDRREISQADFFRLRDAAYQYYVVEKKTSKPSFYKL